MTDPLITNDEVLAVLVDRHADREELGSPARPCEKKVMPPLRWRWKSSPRWTRLPSVTLLMLFFGA